jgi:hypothetical protein
MTAIDGKEEWPRFRAITECFSRRSTPASHNKLGMQHLEQ